MRRSDISRSDSAPPVNTATIKGLPWIPNETNLQRARAHLARIKAQIAAGTFCFADEFPRYRGLQKLPPVLQHRTCGEVFDDFLRHEEARLARGDLATATVTSHRKILDHVWRPHLAEVPFLGVCYSMLIKIADSYPCNKKTYNNAVSALRRAFDFGYLDYPERRDPAASLKCARIGKNDRPPIDPFSIQDPEVLIAAIHQDGAKPKATTMSYAFSPDSAPPRRSPSSSRTTTQLMAC